VITLPAEYEVLIASAAGEPVVQVEIHFPDTYVLRISDRAHTYGGYAFAADIMGDVTYERTMDIKFASLKFTVSNLDSAYTDLFATYTTPELRQADVYAYQYFNGATNRVELFRGKLNVPRELRRDDITLEATQLLNSIMEPFNNLVNSPVCPWATSGLFAGGTRCSYAPATGDGRDVFVDVPSISAVSTTLPVTDIDGVGVGDYLQIENEIVLVTNVGSVSCTVARAQKGTTAAAHIAGTRITHYSCGGSWEECARRYMLHRFGGIRFFNKTGTVSWRTKTFLWFSQKQSMPWESKGNTGVFGSPWGVIYGLVKVAVEPLYVRDPGAHAVFFANLGAGPILGTYHPTAYSPRPSIWVNGKESKDYGLRRGYDGEAQIDWYGSSWDEQGIDYLWISDPTTTPGAQTWDDACDEGQTYSRRAYLCGAFPSDVQTDESLPNVECLIKGRVLPYYNASGTKLGDAWTQNPAWILVDAALNEEYGARLSASDIDWAAMYQAAQDFDTLGVTFNIHLTQSMKFPDFVELLCNSTLSIPTFAENKLGLRVLSSSMSNCGVTIDESLILEDTLEFWGDGPVDRDANTLKVTLCSEDFDYQNVPLEFIDSEHIAALGGRKVELGLKLAGVDNKAQAQRTGAFWLNLAKIARRMDGVKQFRTTYVAMALEPGDIITIDSDSEDSLGALEYMVWSTRRVNNDADYELYCIRWETGLFELGGVTYDLPTTGIDPTRDPVPVTDLAATASLISDDQVRLVVSWTWPEASAPHPAPAKVFLWIGDPEDPFDQYELMTPKGVSRDASSYETTFPRRRWKTARVFAVAQSAWRLPANVRPGAKGDVDYQSTLNGAVTATQTTITVTDATALGVTTDDFVFIPIIEGKYEVSRVSSVAGDTLNMYTWGGNRRAYYNTTASAFPDDQAIYKMELSGPYVDVAMCIKVMPPTDALVYDYNRDTDLLQNEIRVEIPKNNDGSAPSVVHIQLKAENVDWPEPTESPSGSDAFMAQPYANYVLVPTSHNMGSADVGKLFVIKEADDRVGRYIESVTEGFEYLGVTWDKVNLNGPMPRGKGTHSWAVWTKWYELADYNYNAPVSADSLDLQDNTYKVKFTINTEYSGYVRVYLLNEGSCSDPVIAEDESGFPAEISTVTLPFGLDRDQAPVVTDFAITHDGFIAPDGGQRVLCTVQFTPPSPLENFSHVIVYADYPVEEGSGMEGAGGGYSGAGYYAVKIGEFWDSNVQFISQPTSADVTFYCVSVNNDGYYNPDWYDDEDYVNYTTTLTADDNPPGQVQNVDPEHVPGVGIQVKWDALAAADLAYYDVEDKKASTQEGLAGATWTSLTSARSTMAGVGVPPSENGWWYKFRVRGVDNIGQAGEWGESADLQAYAVTLYPVSAPTNLSVGKAWEYQAGVPLIALSINWDNPVDAHYGGCEVWLIDADGGERWDVVTVDDASSTALQLIGDGRTVKVYLFPMNTAGIVPDYNVYVASDDIVLAPDTVDVPEPDVVARDGINCVYLSVEVPPWGSFQKPYSNLEIYINASNTGTGSTKVMDWAVGHSSGSTEREFVVIPFPLMADVTGTWAQGTQYYFFAKLVDRAGNTSGYSADTDNSAVFLPGELTDAGAPDFSSSEEIIRLTAADKYLLITWNAPTIYGTSVYEAQIQVSDESAFARPIINASYNVKSGAHTFIPAANGTFYVRIRYRNNSPAEWSGWFGRIKGDGTTYATIRTIADQAGDTTWILSYGTDVTFVDNPQDDTVTVSFNLPGTTANTLTWWNTSVIWADASSKISDDNYIVANSLTIGWQDNDSWVSVSGATPSTTWIGKVLQRNRGGSPASYDGWIINQIDATNSRVQINGTWGGAQSGQVGRVITPWWQRPGVYGHEVGHDHNLHLVKGTEYTLPKINQMPSGTTIYFEFIHHNIFGPGPRYTTSHTVGDKAYKISEKGQGYANDTPPAGTFSSGGYQWEVAANNTVDFVKTFSFAQHAEELYRADSFVICIRSGGGTPDPTTDKLLVFPVIHLNGSQDYELKVANLDPYTYYTFKLYQAKNTASGLSMNTTATSGKTLTDTDVRYTSADDLILQPKSSSGVVSIRNASNSVAGRLMCYEVQLDDNSDSYLTKITRFGSGMNIENTAVSTKLAAVFGKDYITLSGNAGSDAANLEILPGSAKRIKLRGNTVLSASNPLFLNDAYGGESFDDVGKLYPSSDNVYLENLVSAKDIVLKIAGAGKVWVQCATLRIDQTPSAGTITPDKLIEINMNGTVYQIPCKAKP